MRNVVLICLDSVRKDFFNEYAPRLRDRADLSFEECRAASCWSAPSHASMLTGQLPHQHGIHTYRPHYPPSGVATYLDEFPALDRIGVSSNVYASSSFGFDSLFDSFSDVAPYRRFPEGMDVQKFLRDTDTAGLRRIGTFIDESLHHDHPVKSLANGFLVKASNWMEPFPVAKLFDDGTNTSIRMAERLVKTADEPFFLFVNLMEAHGPMQHTRGYDRQLHDAPNDWSSKSIDIWERNNSNDPDIEDPEIAKYRELYGAAIDYLDRHVCAFVDRIQRTTDSETTVIVTADHGENLGFASDDYLLGHTSSLTEGLLHVPLVVINPPTSTPSEETGLVSHLSLGELVSGILREEVPDVTRDRVPAEVVGISQTSLEPENYEYWDRTIRCVYDDDRKIIWDSIENCEEYELAADRPCWQRHLRDPEAPPEWATALFGTEIETFRRTAKQGDTDDDIDEGTKNRLRDLGYL